MWRCVFSFKHLKIHPDFILKATDNKQIFDNRNSTCTNFIQYFFTEFYSKFPNTMRIQLENFYSFLIFILKFDKLIIYAYLILLSYCCLYLNIKWQIKMAMGYIIALINYSNYNITNWLMWCLIIWYPCFQNFSQSEENLACKHKINT